MKNTGRPGCTVSAACEAIACRLTFMRLRNLPAENKLSHGGRFPSVEIAGTKDPILVGPRPPEVARALRAVD